MRRRESFGIREGLRLNLCASLVLLLTATLIGASATCWSKGSEISPEEILAGAPFEFGESQVAVVGEEEVFATSPEMREFLDTHVDRNAGPSYRLRQLANAVINEGAFDLEYNSITRTAAETFRAGGGNCLSFTIFFVVMARYVDLNVDFQEVDVPPVWTRDGGVSVLNRHINVFVDLGGLHHRIVDFNTSNFEAEYKMRIIPDRRALAHYYNNMGAEHMLAGDPERAFLNYREAILSGDQEYSPAWSNLATLYLREGSADYAEAGYLEALRADRGDLVAISNLAGIYQRRGDFDLAAKYQKKVLYHRERNPYYRYQLAKKAFDAGDYNVAIKHLKYAVRKRRNDDEFHYLMALSYLKKGNKKAALEWLSRAEESTTVETRKEKYLELIDILQSGSVKGSTAPFSSPLVEDLG